ncbi:MAG TPA: pentapeptide repeat-containing protein [Thermoguttaceae bacterium]
MFRNLPTVLCYCIVALLVVIFFGSSVRGDIYQWEWIDPAHPELGKQQSTTICPDGAGVNAVPNADLSLRDLTKAYLINANLTDAFIYSAVLTNADLSQANLAYAGFFFAYLTNANFTDAVVQGAEFHGTTSNGFTSTQLYSTASYKTKNLAGIGLGYNILSGCNFANQNLTGAEFYSAILTNANFIQADLSGAFLAYATLTDANMTDALVQGADFGDTTSRGFTSAQLYSTASYKAKNLAGIGLSENDLTGWNFANQNLTGAIFDYATLKDANFTDALVQGASFGGTTSREFTSTQLYSTASYKAKNLVGIKLYWNDLTSWNFTNQNLNGAIFNYAILTNANLTQANLTSANFFFATLTNTNFTGADMRGAEYVNYTGTITINTIRRDGTIQGLDLSGGRTLIVRDYDGDLGLDHFPHHGPIPIKVKKSMTMGTDGILQMIFEEDAWDSTISFDSGIPVSLGGTLQLTFAQDVNVLGQIGRTFKVFDWSGVSPTGLFSVSSVYDWDLTRLYASGEVTLDYVMNASDTRWTGAKNAKWNDPANWSAGVPLNGAIIEFDSADPAHLPFVQNIANPLSLEAIMFSPNAGEHILGGPTLQLTGGAPTIVCASINDQYIGNPLELADNTVIVVSGSGDLTLGGEIDGSGNLTKRGSGELILANSAMHEGETLIEDGILALDTTGQLENSPITNDAIFQILSGEHTVKAITGGGTTVVDSGSLTVHLIIQDSLTIGTGAKLILAPLTGGSLSGSLTPVPEPATIVLLAMGLVCLLSCSLSVRKQK